MEDNVIMRLHNRQIKASFWNDTDLLQWPREKRMFYVGLIQLADDSGCLEDSPFAFKINLFPSPVDSDITIDLLTAWREELIECNKLISYRVNNKTYLCLVNFHKHQTIKNADSPSVPLPEWIKWETYPSTPHHGKYIVSSDVLQSFFNSSSDVLQSFFNSSSDVLQTFSQPEPEPEPEPEPKKIHSKLSGKPDGDSAQNENSNDEKSRKSSENPAKAIISHLNSVCGTSFSTSSTATRRLISARLKENHGLDDFISVINKKAAQWLNNPQMAKFLRPQTLFGTKFESYLNEPEEHARSPDSLNKKLKLLEEM
jgi:uncharacterized phage protein (TIGR02220 family)